MASLLVVRGPGLGTQYLIRDGSQKLGRDSHCEVHLDDSETSRHHAEICKSHGQHIIRDLGSSNGTIVNGKKITSDFVLTSGDRIQIGRRLLVFRPKSHRDQNPVGDVDIVASHENDASQIVGRADIDSPVDGTIAWSSSDLSDATKIRSHWEIMYRTSLAVSRTLDIDQLLHQILDLIFQWVACDRGCVMLQDAESGQLRPSCRKNRRKGAAANRMSISKTILDYVVKHEEGVLTSDAGVDQRWDTSASIASGGICEAMCVPMRGRYGMVGAIYIDTFIPPGENTVSPNKRIFSEEHLKMLVSIGHQAALAIEDTTYYQSMVQAERLAVIGQTIATLSHHVKNIVQGLRGAGFMIQEGLKREEWDSIRGGWKICERTHARIESLVLDMLSMSKDRKPEREVVDLRNLVDEVIELMSPTANELSISFEWDRPADFPLMMLDGEAIHRAVLNLVTNAIDACAERSDGKVAIRVSHNSENVSIQVQDNGVGIPEADLQKIFSLFESTKGSRGTGLGLPVSLKIAKEHGGTIHVQSTVGTGTTFEFVLPWRSNMPAPEMKTMTG